MGGLGAQAKATADLFTKIAADFDRIAVTLLVQGSLFLIKASISLAPQGMPLIARFSPTFI
ncbi:MAG: hypothetical protein DYG89_41040 [Caldilinea sp. CFX5]|nr:hypothetical protein [Caldilinea sp. CFX5]